MEPFINIIANVHHGIFWEIRAVLDLSLGGLGAGALIIAVAASLYNEKKYNGICKVGAYIAPIAVVLGLSIMLSELTQPLRMWRAYFGYFTSPFTWGAWLQQIFVVLSVAYAALWYKGMVKESLRRKVGIVALVFAVLVAIYHGMFLSVLSARGMWNSAMIPVLFLISALTTGTAAVILIAALTGKTEAAGIAKLNKVLTALIGIEALFLAVYLLVLFSSSVEAVAGGRILIVGALSMWFWLGLVISGLLLPFALGVIYVLKKSEVMAIPIINSLLVLIGGFILRYTILIAGQSVPIS